MQVMAAALYVEEGELGPALRKVTFDGESWAAHEVSFMTSESAMEAWNALGLDGYLTADEGYFYVGKTPDAASVTLDAHAGHIFVTLDATSPQTSSIGFVANANWILENGIGFLRTVVNTPRELQDIAERVVN